MKEIEKEKFEGKEDKLLNEVEIMNVKCDPNMIDAIVNNKNIIRSYHMNKKHWITVILDGSLKDSNINELIDIINEMKENEVIKNG